MAQQANTDMPLVWITAAPPDALQEDFLETYARKQPVWRIMPDWRRSAVGATFAAAWPELLENNESAARTEPTELSAPPGLALYAASSLEDEAMRERLVQENAKIWLKRDRPAAEAWIAEAPSLSDALKEKLLTPPAQ